MIRSDSINEVGCIHTSQGLELDHVGVIIGDDLIVRNGQIITNGLNRARTDNSLKGLITKIRRGDEYAIKQADKIIKNTYRVLMTRGMKGCYIYCTDPETREYFKQKLLESNSISYENLLK